MQIKEIARHLRQLSGFLVKNKYFHFWERFWVVLSVFGGKYSRDSFIRHLVLKRRIKSGDGSEFLLMDEYKIFFKPDWATFTDNRLDGVAMQIIKEAFMFPEFFSSRSFVKKGDVVLDIGASMGVTSIYFSEFAGVEGRVFAFEPVTYSVIERNVKENNIKNIEVVDKGVSSQTGETEIEISDYFIDSSICKRDYTKGQYKNNKTIKTISLDEFAEEKGLSRINFIKMDIEGAEELALKGAKNIIKKFRPKWSISSYHIDFNNEPQHNKLVKLLKDYGYKIEEEKGHRIWAW